MIKFNADKWQALRRKNDCDGDLWSVIQNRRMWISSSKTKPKVASILVLMGLIETYYFTHSCNGVK